MANGSESEAERDAEETVDEFARLMADPVFATAYADVLSERMDEARRKLPSARTDRS